MPPTGNARLYRPKSLGQQIFAIFLNYFNCLILLKFRDNSICGRRFRQHHPGKFPFADLDNGGKAGRQDPPAVSHPPAVNPDRALPHQPMRLGGARHQAGGLKQIGERQAVLIDFRSIGFYPDFTDGLKTSQHLQFRLATLRRILGLWNHSISLLSHKHS